MTDQQGLIVCSGAAILISSAVKIPFLRAQWAAKPFIWHIYPQEDDYHLIKLKLFSNFTAIICHLKLLVIGLN